MIPFKRYRPDVRTPLKEYPDSAGNDLYANEQNFYQLEGECA